MQPESSVILYIANTDDIVLEPTSSEDLPINVDNHELLKAMWNNGTMAERQAIVDALPKIQVISVAGVIQ